MLSSLAVLALLLVWWFVSPGGGGGTTQADKPGGKNPVPSITPGPSGSGPAISEHPGGRDEPGADGEEDDDGAGGSEEAGGGSGSAGGDEGTAGGGAGGAKGGGGSGDRLPAGSKLPDCASGPVTVTLRSVSTSYEPGEKPRFELIAKNTGDAACKVDLGPARAVLTITQSSTLKEIWSSDDCSKSGGSLLLRVPAQNRITQTTEWDRKPSAPQCATPPAGSATAGTYLVEAEIPGFPKAQTSFVLSEA